MIHHMHLAQPYFDLMVAGLKTIEVRVADTKRCLIQPGHGIRFRCQDRVLLVTVQRITKYRDFAELLNYEDQQKVNPQLSGQQLLTSLRAIYPFHREMLGALAFEVALAPDPSSEV